MRDLNTLNHHRQVHIELASYGQAGDSENGVFVIPSAFDGTDLRVIASTGGGWDHVSVSCANRCPTWDEMEQVARLCFADNEAAMQLHVPMGEHINAHPYCLHWWRPQGRKLHRPPGWMVGPGGR